MRTRLRAARRTRTAIALGAVLALGAGAGAATAHPPLQAAVVRPGMVLSIALPTFDNSCTAGFVFRATDTRPPRRSAHYLATSGHCLFVDPEATEEVHRDGSGPVISLMARSLDGVAMPGRRIGKVVYAAQTVPVLYEDPTLPPLLDLGLIRLDDGVVADPSLCYFGGPIGLRTTDLTVPEPLRFYGAGNTTGFHRETGTTLVPGRTALGSSGAHPHVVVGEFPSSSGDSGSPIIDSAGLAVSLLSGPYQPRIDRMLPHVEKVLGVDLELRTAPLRKGTGPIGTDPACIPPIQQ